MTELLVIALICVAAALLVSMLVVVRISRAVGRTVSGGGGGGEHPSVPALRDRARELTTSLVQVNRVLASASAEVSRLGGDYEALAIATWNSRRTAAKQCRHLADGLLAILDAEHADSPGPEMLPSVFRLARNALEEAGIHEIPVARGETFTGERHRELGRRFAEIPAGEVVEVVRRGYRISEEGGESFVLRPAEVVVSRGPEPSAPEPEPESSAPPTEPERPDEEHDEANA